MAYRYEPQYLSGDPDGLSYMQRKNVDDYLDYGGLFLRKHLKEFFSRKDAKAYLNNEEYYHLFVIYNSFTDEEYGFKLSPLSLAHFLYLLNINPFNDWDKEDIEDIFSQENMRYFKEL